MYADESAVWLIAELVHVNKQGEGCPLAIGRRVGEASVRDPTNLHFRNDVDLIFKFFHSLHGKSDVVFDLSDRLWGYCECLIST